jgi:LysR family transcriptional regulator AphB
MRAQFTKNGTRHPIFGTVSAGLLDDLALFVAVARHGSFVAAARHTRTPTSTVSRAIARLEERMELSLFRRTSRNVSLTEEGRQVLLRAGPYLDGLDEALTEALDRRSEPAGLIRITAPTFTGATKVTELLAAFARRHPRISIELDASNALRDLVADGYDLGIRVGPTADADFVARKLWTGQFGLYATEELLGKTAAKRRRGERVRTIDRGVLERGPCVVTRSTATWRFRDREGRVMQVKPRARFVVNDPRAAVLAARAGIGFVLAPMEAAVDVAGLLPLSCEGMAPEPTELYLVYPTRRLLPARVRLLLEWLLSGA